MPVSKKPNKKTAKAIEPGNAGLRLAMPDRQGVKGATSEKAKSEKPALQAKSWRGVLLLGLLAVCYIGAGFLVFYDLSLAMKLVPLLAGVAFVVSGIIWLRIAFIDESAGVWIWGAIGAVIMLLIGLLNLARFAAGFWPH
jgi:uncharacterized membrane protein HdeD (DUF308 family)